MNFASDNTAGIAPAILDALAEANRGYARGYGNDDWTQRVERRFCEIFEREVAVFLVPTGTAANALALAQVSPPWGVVFCHAESHIATDECGAPEFFGHGLKLAGLPGDGAKIAADDAARRRSPAMAAIPRIRWCRRRCRSPRPAKPAPSTAPARSRRWPRSRMRAGSPCTWMARALPMRWCGSTPVRRRLTWRSGVDVLSLGATKGGALAAEAVIIFDPVRAAFMGERRKRAGHLLSKHRFIAAQFLAYLAEDRWLTLARHANAMADRLAEKLTAVGLKPVWPVEANLIFVVLPRALDARLQAAGATYYVRSSDSLDVGADNVLVRLVTSFATEQSDIERFVDHCKKS